jgi:hypothetical protein
MKKYNNIIIDGNNLFWRCFSGGLKKYVTIEDFHLFLGTIKINLDKIETIKKLYAYTSSVFYFCFDNPESVLNLRKFLDNNYKSHRFKKNSPKGLYKTLNLFVELLKVFSDNYRIANANSLEADDLTLPIIKELNLSKENRCLVISNDLDWARNLSLSKYCFWWNYDKMHNRKTFESEYGFSPVGKKIQLFKAIHGDTTDNIKNAVPYLPREILLNMVNEFNDVDELFNGMWKQEYSLKWKKKIKDAEKDIRANYYLVDFIELNYPIENYVWTCKRNIKKLRLFYDVLDLKYESFMHTESQLKLNMFSKK